MDLFKLLYTGKSSPMLFVVMNEDVNVVIDWKTVGVPNRILKTRTLQRLNAQCRRRCRGEWKPRRRWSRNHKCPDWRIGKLFSDTKTDRFVGNGAGERLLVAI